MTPPRQPTHEERALWREHNRNTKVSVVTGSDVSDINTGTLSSSSEGCRDKKASKRSAALPRPLTQPSPARGEGFPAAPLSPLSMREAKRAFAPYPLDATLDLHGLGKLDAYARVQQFIDHQHRAGRRHVQIITGKGKAGEVGVLRQSLPQWLNESPLRPRISAFATARPEKGGTGVLHVLLKAR
jgi:DNA-nicking Smr family endonuclease